MPLGQNVTGMNIGILGMNVIIGQNVTRENAIMNFDQPFLFSFLQNNSAPASAPTVEFFFQHGAVEMTTKDL